MDPKSRRILITVLLIVFLIGTLTTVRLCGEPREYISAIDLVTPDDETEMVESRETPQPEAQRRDEPHDLLRDDDPRTPPPDPPDDDLIADPPDAPDPDPEAQPLPPDFFADLRAVAPDDVTPSRAPMRLGSDDPLRDLLLVELTLDGAGIERITSTMHWQDSVAAHQAERRLRDLRAGREPTTPMPDPDKRLIIQEAQEYYWGYDRDERQWLGRLMPVFSMHSLFITPADGEEQRISMLSGEDTGGNVIERWVYTGDGRFESLIVNGQGQPIGRVVRQYRLTGASYGLTIEQRFQNLTDQPMEVRMVVHSPSDMPRDPADYIDPRRFHVGYLHSLDVDPHRFAGVLSDDFRTQRASVINAFKRDRRENFWPPPAMVERGDDYELSWFAVTNRYFALVMHPPGDPSGVTDLSLNDRIDRIFPTVDRRTEDRVFIEAFTKPEEVAGGREVAFDLGLYAGPLDRRLLDNEEPYASLDMSGLILYAMTTGCCAICTFQWLAHLLLNLLSVIHDYVFLDWALAIIVLVLIVKGLLHPVTRRAQINMQRFARVMGKLKPDIEKLQKKYKDDPKKLQQEQLRLMREHGVNPFQMLGCLPLLLQAPIWIALWAVLYFAYDLRHDAAFYGFFQLLGGWSFLADLSSSDNFVKFASPVPLPFLPVTLTGFNLLPIIMGVVFYLQQKYMTPPPSATMTEDQIRQQKMIRVMMIFMLPVVLYPAPAGLTLYIMTSSCVGIIEGRYIRRQVEQMNLDAPVIRQALPDPKKKKKKRPKDLETGPYHEGNEAPRNRDRRKGGKSFKKRKQ